MTSEGDRLVLGEVQRADGRTARVVDEEADEYEVGSCQDGMDVPALEVDLDDGRVEIRICAVDG